MKKIVTISREFGSGGRFIAEVLAKELGYAYYDKELITQVAKETGLSEKYIAEHGEYAPKNSIFSYAFVGRDLQGATMDDYIYQVQRKIICDIAQKENCVIVGRCADYILRDREDVLNVFIHGEKTEKVKRISSLYQKTEKESLALIKEIDKKRSINYAYYTEQKWGDMKNYALSLNSSILGYGNCVKMIKETVMRLNQEDEKDDRL